MTHVGTVESGVTALAGVLSIPAPGSVSGVVAQATEHWEPVCFPG